MATQYHIYSNTGIGDAVDYTTVVATVATLTWTSPALAASSAWKWAVRAFDTVTGLEDANLDAVVAVTLDASQHDVSRMPAAPHGLSVRPMLGGDLRVEWFATVSPRDLKRPTSFKVYIGTGGTPSYTSPAATVTAILGLAQYSAVLTGLIGGTAYTVGVRSVNSAGTEENTTTATATSDTTAPTNVDSLAGVASH